MNNQNIDDITQFFNEVQKNDNYINQTETINKLTNVILQLHNENIALRSENKSLNNMLYQFRERYNYIANNYTLVKKNKYYNKLLKIKFNLFILL